MKKYIFSSFLSLLFINVEAQSIENFFEIHKHTKVQRVENGHFENLPKSYSEANINIFNLYDDLRLVEQEISIPDPNGDFVRFVIRPSFVVSEKVKSEYSIKTFVGHEVDNPAVIIACDISDNGFHAAIFSEQTYFIEPLSLGNFSHLIYYKSDLTVPKVACGVQDNTEGIKDQMEINRSAAANTLRTYDLAIVAAGEYSVQFGGTPYNVTNVLNALASGVNILNPIFKRDLGIEFVLVTTAALVFSSPATDPFNPAGSGSTMLSVCHTTCVNALGNGGFDIGHLVFWANYGGLAQLGVTCNSSFKGRGYSGNNGTLQTLWVDYISHEIGHQFNSRHNFNGSCSGNSSSNYRYEPGEGSSIMCYAGVCSAPLSYQSTSDPFFHYRSIEQIIAFVSGAGGTCASTNSSGNTSDPIPDAKSDIVIPKETPFILVGAATDANDPLVSLTYDWEQYNGNGSATTTGPNCNSTNEPMFRYRPPFMEPYRHMPAYDEVLMGNNNGVAFEKLPCVARTMNFSMAVRDNNSSFGRVDHDQMVVTVANTGPFTVNLPNGGEITDGGNPYNVTWAVNGTDAHCPNVDILVSIDGGITYTIAKANTANDGNKNIVLPSVATSNARVLVQCHVSGNFRSESTFYDVSNNDFTINFTENCVDNLVVTINPIPSGTYKAVLSVESSSTVMPVNNVIFQSENEILLTAGFEVPAMTNFEANILDCN